MKNKQKTKLEEFIEFIARVYSGFLILFIGLMAAAGFITGTMSLTLWFYMIEKKIPAFFYYLMKGFSVFVDIGIALALIFAFASFINWCKKKHGKR